MKINILWLVSRETQGYILANMTTHNNNNYNQAKIYIKTQKGLPFGRPFHVMKRGEYVKTSCPVLSKVRFGGFFRPFRNNYMVFNIILGFRFV